MALDKLELDGSEDGESAGIKINLAIDLINEQEAETAIVPSPAGGYMSNIWHLDGSGPDESKVGAGTLDLQQGDASMPDRGHIGDMSYCNGWNNKGDGYAAVTSGWDNYGNGNYSIIAGISNTTSGGGVIMAGEALDGSGGDVMIIAGRCNTKPTGNPYVLQLGNGTVASGGGTGPTDRARKRLVPSDAFRVYKRGVAEAPTCTTQFIDDLGEKAVPTAEWINRGGDTTSRPTTPMLFSSYWDTSLKLRITCTDNTVGALVWMDTQGNVV